MKDMIVDRMSKTIWMVSSKILYKLPIEDEDKEVWKYYLAMGSLNESFKKCKEKKSPNQAYVRRPALIVIGCWSLC